MEQQELKAKSRGYKWGVLALVILAVITAGVVAWDRFAVKEDFSETPAPAPVPAPEPTTEEEPEEEGTEVGKLASDFQLPGLDGQMVSLSDFQGKAVLLNFWATWDGPSRVEMPFLQQVHEEKSGEVVLLAVNIGEDQSEVEEFMENLDLSFLTVLDTDERMAQQYNIRIIPTTFFIDREGVIQDIKIGAFASESEIIAQLDKAIP